MAGTAEVGSIVYEIEMDVANLITAQRQVESRLSSMEAGFDRNTKSVEKSESAMSSLTGVARGLAAAISVQQVTEYANAWVNVSNKLVNSTRANEDLFTVTQRVFDISQDTRSSLEATATLYGRLERATRSAGTSTADLSKLVETINKGLTVSGATTEEASSTMIQLSQALASGVLRGEEFNSISENGSRLAVALADSLGVTIGQLRNMAAQGKLTTEVVVNGLLKQSDAIGKEFANTALTMGQSFAVATNNITKFVGENTSVNTSLKVFNSTVITLSESLDSISALIGAAAVVMGSRFVGALVASTSARVSDALAAKAQASATADAALAAQNAARIVTVKTALDREAAISSLALAQAEYNVAKGSAAEAFALENLNTIKTIAIQRSAAFAEAQLAQSTATNAATVAAAAATTTVGGLARGALSLIGGPAGAAVIAAAAIFYFYQKAQQAKQESIDFANKLDGVIARMKEMSQVQLAAEIDNANKSIVAQNSALTESQNALNDVNSRLDSAKQAVSGLGQSSLFYADAVNKMNALQSQSTQLTAQVERQTNTLSQTISKTGIIQAQLNGNFAQGIDLLKRNGHEASISSGLFNQLANSLDLAGKAKDKFNSTSLIVERPKNVQEYLDKLNDQVEIQGELNERKRAQLKAEKEIRNLGGSDADVNLARQRAAAEFDSLKAQQAIKKETKDGNAAQKKAETSAESVAQKLANLKQQSELAADSTTSLSRAQAVLTAQQSLGSTATQNDIQLAGQYAAKKWDTANAIRAQVAAEKLVPETKENASYAQDVKDLNTALSAKKITQQQYNATSEQLEQQRQANLAKIKADQVVTPQQQAAGMVDPVQALANENAQKLALIQQFEASKTITEQQGIALRNAANTAYEKARTDAQWAIFEQQGTGYKVLGAAIDGFSSQAASSLTGLITGTESASDAFKDLGNSILNSVIQALVEVGIQYLKNAAMAMIADKMTSNSSSQAGAQTAAAWAPAAAAASIATFGGAAVAGIVGMVAAYGISASLAGKRKNGGPVSAGSMYQVGESGLPEIYKASNGSQYMIPGDNGKVISNKDIQNGSSSSGGVQVNVYNQNGSDVQTSASKGLTGQDVINIIINDAQQSGPATRAIASRTGARMQATGDY